MRDFSITQPVMPVMVFSSAHLCLGEVEGEGQVEPLAHREVPRRLELVLQRHQLWAREQIKYTYVVRASLDCFLYFLNLSTLLTLHFL